MGTSFRRAVLVGLGCVAICHAQTIATWSGGKDAAFSLTFDDNHPVQVKYATQEMDKRGIRGSFYIVTWNRTPDDGWYRPDWSQLTSAATTGHEIGGHSCTHTGTVQEVKPCIDSLKAHFPAKKWFTWAYPGGDASALTEVMHYVIGARSWDNNHGIEAANPASYFSVRAINGWSNSFPLANDNTWIKQAITAKGWGVETIHCISGPGEACDLALTFTSVQFGMHLDSVLAYRDRLWIAPFGDVVRYIRERRCAAVSTASSTADTVRLTLTDTLSDNAVYDVPLTIKMRLPAGWSDASATQGSKDLVVVVAQDTIFVDGVPDAGLVVVGRKGASAIGQSTRHGDRAKRFGSRISTTNGILDITTPGSCSLSARLFSLEGLVLRTATGVASVRIPVQAGVYVVDVAARGEEPVREVVVVR